MKFSKWNIRRSDLIVGIILCFLLITGLIVFFVGRDRDLPLTMLQLSINPYEESSFYREGEFIRCTQAETKVGVDVSSHQGEIDWNAVKEAGVDYAMIRVGWRGYTEGGLNVDTSALQNLQGATEAGLPVGVYLYSQAITVQEAKEEAKLVLDVIKDWNITYPVVYDWEWIGGDARTVNVDSRTVTDCTKAFCNAIQDAGYTPAFYFNQDLASRLFCLEELQVYDFWLAQYTEAMTFPYNVEMWQYSCTAALPGIEGEVDLNLSFKDYETPIEVPSNPK